MEPTLSVSFSESTEIEKCNKFYTTPEFYFIMIISPNQMCLYNTSNLEPYILISNRHLYNLTSFWWHKDFRFGVSSMDGYITFGQFEIDFEEDENSFSNFSD